MVVLLVERNPELQLEFAEALRAAGYSVVVASDRSAAVRAAQAQPPAIVVLDASLDPGEAARFLSELRRESASLAVVGIAYRFGAERGILEAGAQCCIRHLPTPDEVVNAVRWAVEVYGETAA